MGYHWRFQPPSWLKSNPLFINRRKKKFSNAFSSGKSEHPELHTLLLETDLLFSCQSVALYLFSVHTRVENPLSQMRGRKQQSHFIAFDVSPCNRRAADPLADKRGAGSHICLFLTATADNSINGSFAVTVLLDPSVTLSPKGNWIHLVSQQQLSDWEKYFSNWIRGFSECLQMMPLMSALLEYSSIVGNVAKLFTCSVLCYQIQGYIFVYSTILVDYVL